MAPSVVELLLNMRSAQDVERAVKATCLVGFASGVIYIVAAFWVASSQLQNMGVAIYLGGALLTFLMVFGVMRFSRLAAAGLLAVCMATQALVWMGEPSAVRVLTGILSIFFVFIFVRGVQATFVHHKLTRRFDAWQRTMDSALDPRLFEDE